MLESYMATLCFVEKIGLFGQKIVNITYVLRLNTPSTYRRNWSIGFPGSTFCSEEFPAKLSALWEWKNSCFVTFSVCWKQFGTSRASCQYCFAQGFLKLSSFFGPLWERDWKFNSTSLERSVWHSPWGSEFESGYRKNTKMGHFLVKNLKLAWSQTRIYCSKAFCRTSRPPDFSRTSRIPLLEPVKYFWPFTNDRKTRNYNGWLFF